MLDVQQAADARGHRLLDHDGQKIGSIEEIYLDRDTGQPEWALVNTGLFGMQSTFVPLQQATSEGEDLRVPISKDQAKDAPRIEPSAELSETEEAELYRYYGLQYSEPASGVGDHEEAGRSSGEEAAMTRSEEELNVGTRQRETGRLRLRKYETVEHVQTTVPVRREKARVVREPISGESADRTTDRSDWAEGEQEVVLHEEEPVVEKRAVPKERVRVDKDVVTEEESVSEELRKEEIDLVEEDQRKR
ncbi:MAG TPA: PRC and DUF2382 domain-containing protein [Egibacteraceae bacterium]|nr:PRC and DUF2382 domain-containing protein [Egibacteraceae bacterium]